MLRVRRRDHQAYVKSMQVAVTCEVTATFMAQSLRMSCKEENHEVVIKKSGCESSGFLILGCCDYTLFNP